MNFPNLKLTALGINAVLDAVYNEDTVEFTCVKMGSGRTSAAAEDMTDLVAYEKTIGISSITVGTGTATLAFSFNNASLENDFYMREIGIFAHINDGEEFLYAYANAGEEAVIVKKYSDDDNVSMSFVVTVAIGNAEHVTAIISGAVGYVTQGDFNEHIYNYNNPHRVTKEQLGLENVQNVTPSNMTITFSSASTLTEPASNSSLSTLMGLLSKAIKDLAAHLRDSSNPHNVRYSQTGAAAAVHSHDAGDIRTGTLPLARGGTGVTSKAALRQLVKRAIAYETATLFAASWSGSGTYNLNRAGYDVIVSLAPTATESERKVYGLACIVGSHNSNVLTALGTVPSIDIPVIIMTMEVL